MCPTRLAARPSRSHRCRVIIPTAGACCRSSAQARERIAPFCPHFGICGGCAIQHWEAERYRAWKRDLVVETLAQAKLDCEVDPLIDAHGLGRRRITLHARMGTHDVLKVGFAAANSHDIIPVDRCPILDPGLERRARCGLGDRRAADRQPESRSTSRSRPPTTASMSTCAARGRCRRRMIATLSRIAEQHRLARLTRHGELVLMRTPPTIAIGAAQLTLPPGSFLQATVAGEEALAALVIGALQARQAYRRPVLRGRAVCPEAGGKVADFGLRQRCRRGRGAAEGRDGDLRD